MKAYVDRKYTDSSRENSSLEQVSAAQSSCVLNHAFQFVDQMGAERVVLLLDTIAVGSLNFILPIG